MNAAEYKKLKKDVEERYQKALQGAEKDRLEELAAIEKVWRMIKPPRRIKAETASGPSQYGSLVVTVRKALDLVPQRFTKKNVLAAMQQISPDMANCNPNSLSGCLHRMKRDGIILAVSRGRGSRPTEYEKANSSRIKDDESQEQTTE